EATREPLRNLLMGVESIWLEAECARYEFFFDVIHQSELDVVVISLDADETKAINLISQVSDQYPQLPILAVSKGDDGQSILKALRSGAREFLTQPVVLEELLTAFKRLRQNRIAADSHQGNGFAKKLETNVIAIAGSGGGVGCTSLAVNLGVSLAQNPDYSVALIDLDLALGDADVALDLMPDYTLADVALNIERLDMTFLRRSLCKHASAISLL